MAVKTCLDVVKEFCYRINEPAVSALASTTSPKNLQLRELFYQTGEYIRENYDYPSLKRKYTFSTASGTKYYPLPGDFYRLLFQTQFDDTNNWALFGPVADGEIAARDKGTVLNDTQYSYRITSHLFDEVGQTSFDVAGGYIEISPTPSDVRTLSIEYIGANWFLPPQWQASQGYTDGDLFSASRNIYKATSSGTTNSTRPSGESGLTATYGIDYQLWRDQYNVLGAGDDTFTDTDYPVIDPHTLKLGLVAFWREAKKLKNDTEMQMFHQSCMNAQGRFQGLQGTSSDSDELYAFPWLSEDYVSTGW